MRTEQVMGLVLAVDGRRPGAALPAAGAGSTPPTTPSPESGPVRRASGPTARGTSTCGAGGSAAASSSSSACCWSPASSGRLRSEWVPGPRARCGCRRASAPATPSTAIRTARPTAAPAARLGSVRAASSCAWIPLLPRLAADRCRSTCVDTGTPTDAAAGYGLRDAGRRRRRRDGRPGTYRTPSCRASSSGGYVAPAGRHRRSRPRSPGWSWPGHRGTCAQPALRGRGREARPTPSTRAGSAGSPPG